MKHSYSKEEIISILHGICDIKMKNGEVEIYFSDDPLDPYHKKDFVPMSFSSALTELIEEYAIPNHQIIDTLCEHQYLPDEDGTVYTCGDDDDLQEVDGIMLCYKHRD